MAALSRLEALSRAGDGAGVARLLREPESKNFLRTGEGAARLGRCLIAAAQIGGRRAADVVEAILGEQGRPDVVNFCEAGGDGNTCLHWAAYYGHAAFVSRVMRCAACDVFARNRSGQTAYALAKRGVKGGARLCARMLAEHRCRGGRRPIPSQHPNFSTPRRPQPQNRRGSGGRGSEHVRRRLIPAEDRDRDRVKSEPSTRCIQQNPIDDERTLWASKPPHNASISAPVTSGTSGGGGRQSKLPENNPKMSRLPDPPASSYVPKPIYRIRSIDWNSQKEREKRRLRRLKIVDMFSTV